MNNNIAILFIIWSIGVFIFVGISQSKPFAHGHQYECDYGVHHHEVNCIDSQGIYKTFTVSE